VISVLSFSGYFVISRVVLNLFPFSSFGMYAGGEKPSCQLLAIGPEGRALDVSRFRAWECPPWQEAAQKTIEQARCEAYRGNIDMVRERIEASGPPDAASVPVSLVRRTWSFRGNDPPRIRDLPVAACRAVPQ
jgi:hypothetical protein